MKKFYQINIFINKYNNNGHYASTYCEITE
jgi:hypothetical protein